MYQLQRQLDELLERHGELEAQLETERQVRIESQVLDSLASRVSQPRQFLQLLETQGVLVERAGQPMVRTSLGLSPLAEGVDELLEGEFSHYSLSKAPAAGKTEANSNLKYFGEDGLKLADDQLTKVLSSEAESRALFNELETFLPQSNTRAPADQPDYDSVRPQAQMQPSTTGNMPSDVEIEQALNNPQKFDQLLAKYAL